MKMLDYFIGQLSTSHPLSKIVSGCMGQASLSRRHVWCLNRMCLDAEVLKLMEWRSQFGDLDNLLGLFPVAPGLSLPSFDYMRAEYAALTSRLDGNASYFPVLRFQSGAFVVSPMRSQKQRLVDGASSMQLQQSPLTGGYPLFRLLYDTELGHTPDTIEPIQMFDTVDNMLAGLGACYEHGVYRMDTRHSVKCIDSTMETKLMLMHNPGSAGYWKQRLTS